MSENPNDRQFDGWWWLSFCNGDDGRFLGACVVRGHDIVSAAKEAHRRKCNPGGECLGVGILDLDKVPPSKWRNRLLSRKECTDMEIEMGVDEPCRVVPDNVQEQLPHLCPEHNAR